MGKRVYTVRISRDETGYWVAESALDGGNSAVTDGQTLPKIRRRIRQAISLVLEVPEDSFDVREKLDLPKRVVSLIDQYDKARKAAAEEHRRASLHAAAATRALTELGVSRRDAGNLLGLTGGRVQQLLDARE